MGDSETARGHGEYWNHDQMMQAMRSFQSARVAAMAGDGENVAPFVVCATLI